ncbi:hypothetical protein D3C72_1035660 [compost metagenome]
MANMCVWNSDGEALNLVFPPDNAGSSGLTEVSHAVLEFDNRFENRAREIHSFEPVTGRGYR